MIFWTYFLYIRNKPPYRESAGNALKMRTKHHHHFSCFSFFSLSFMLLLCHLHLAQPSPPHFVALPSPSLLLHRLVELSTGPPHISLPPSPSYLHHRYVSDPSSISSRGSSNLPSARLPPPLPLGFSRPTPSETQSWVSVASQIQVGHEYCKTRPSHLLLHFSFFFFSFSFLFLLGHD